MNNSLEQQLIKSGFADSSKSEAIDELRQCQELFDMIRHSTNFDVSDSEFENFFNEYEEIKVAVNSQNKELNNQVKSLISLKEKLKCYLDGITGEKGIKKIEEKFIKKIFGEK